MNMPLGHEVIGDGQQTLVFLHGFTQTRASWRPIATQLVSHFPNLRALLLDLPGHGDSTHVSADLHTTAALVHECAGEATYVGYSLGARVTLSALVAFPASVHHAIVVSGTAGIESDDERLARHNADSVLAARIITIGVEKFIEEWLAQPLFAGLAHDTNLLAERLSNTPAGLADSLLRCGQGSQQPLWSKLRSYPNPLLAIAGAQDEKYVALARRLAATMPNASSHIVSDAGHSAHLEQPAAVIAVMQRWCTEWLAP